MNEKSNGTNDPKKKYWVIIFVAVPIIVALIALIPCFLKAKTPESGKGQVINQKNEHVDQKSKSGNNFSNVVGDINVGSDGKKEEKRK